MVIVAIFLCAEQGEEPGRCELSSGAALHDQFLPTSSGGFAIIFREPLELTTFVAISSFSLLVVRWKGALPKVLAKLTNACFCVQSATVDEANGEAVLERSDAEVGARVRSFGCDEWLYTSIFQRMSCCSLVLTRKFSFLPHQQCWPEAVSPRALGGDTEDGGVTGVPNHTDPLLPC